MRETLSYVFAANGLEGEKDGKDRERGAGENKCKVELNMSLLSVLTYNDWPKIQDNFDDKLRGKLSKYELNFTLGMANLYEVFNLLLSLQKLQSPKNYISLIKKGYYSEKRDLRSKDPIS